MIVKGLRIGLLIAAGMHLAWPAHALDQAGPALAGLDLAHHASAGAGRVPFAVLRPAFRPADKLAAAISAAGKVDMVQGGVAGSAWALLECQRGDYPGGGMGVLSLPFGRPSARTDHCWH